MTNGEKIVHCWEGKGEWIEERFGFRSQEYLEYLADEDRCTCMLPRGHDGPHEWTPDKNIVIRFKGASNVVRH